MDQELVICKICKKVFRDVQGLNQHKMQLHSQPQRQQSSIQATTTNQNKDSFVSHQFRNNSNISITRICKPETNQSAIVSQSSMNQNSFRKTSASPSITVRRQEMKTKQTEGSRVKAPFRSPGVKGGQASVKSMVLGQLDVEADTTDKWQKWEPQVPKPAPSAALTISKSAAEVAASAATTARKSVPPLHPLHPVPGGKRPVAGMNKVGSGAAAVGRGAAGNSVVTDIMQNLGKIKSLNQQQRPAPPKQKLISLAPAKKGAPLPLPQVQKKLVKQAPRMQAQPAPVPKNKMKAAPINNALPKANAAQASRKLMMEDVEDSSDLQEEETDTELDLEPYVPQLPPKKATSPGKGKASAGGKAPPPSKSLNTNRFNPIESPKKAKGKAAAAASTTITQSPKGSPNGKSKAGASAAASSSNGTNKLTPAAPSSVVGKKSIPSQDAKGGKKKKKLDQVGKLKQLVPTMAGTEYEMPKLSAIGSYTNRAGHQVWVCLVCNEKEHEESSRDMICCEMCDDWYHWECVGIRQAPEEEDDWYCKRCIYQVVPNAKKVFPRIFRDDILD